MRREPPLLTIAIPTYNRRDCLTELLEVLGPQLSGETRVELIVSDNASQDDTPGVIESFREKGLDFTYNRNETNLGADGNFLRCYDMAKGEYVWIFGDDDIILPGGLRTVLACLEKRKYDLLYLRASGFQGKYEFAGNSRFTGQVREFATPRDFALYASTNLTFISANISRKAALAPGAFQDFSDFVGTSLIQLSWTFSLLKGNARCACLLDKVIAARLNNGGDHGTCEVFGTNLKAIVKEQFGLPSPIGSAIVNRTIQGFFPWAMLQRRRSSNSRHLPEDPVAILKSLYHDNPRYWLFVHPVLTLPLPLASAWVFFGKVTSRVDRVLGYRLAR